MTALYGRLSGARWARAAAAALVMVVVWAAYGQVAVATGLPSIATDTAIGILSLVSVGFVAGVASGRWRDAVATLVATVATWAIGLLVIQAAGPSASDDSAVTEIAVFAGYASVCVVGGHALGVLARAALRR